MIYVYFWTEVKINKTKKETHNPINQQRGNKGEQRGIEVENALENKEEISGKLAKMSAFSPKYTPNCVINRTTGLLKYTQ